MLTKAYDGHTLVTIDSKFDNDLVAAETHRRKVRWYLRSEKLNRLADNFDLTSKDKR